MLTHGLRIKRYHENSLIEIKRQTAITFIKVQPTVKEKYHGYRLDCSLSKLPTSWPITFVSADFIYHGRVGRAFHKPRQ